MNGTAITAGDEILVANLGNITYEPAANFSGNASFTWKASDGTSYSAASATITFAIAAVNEAPSITSVTTASVAENISGAIYTATATDPDTADIITWSISGTDAGLFDINSSTGILTFKATPNFETPLDSDTDNVYNLTITATDNGTVILSDTQYVAITVTNVNDAPEITSGAAVSFTEGGTGTVYVVTGNDPEGSVITWSLGGTDVGQFNLSSTGALTFKNTPSHGSHADIDHNNVYDLTITAEDSEHVQTTINLTVTVTALSYSRDEYVPSPNPIIGSAVFVNGVEHTAGTTKITTIDDQIITTVTIDDAKLETILQQQDSNTMVTIPVGTRTDIVVGQLNGQTVKNMEMKEYVLEIKTDTVTYTLPASEINIDSVSAQIGEQVKLEDIKVSVSIAEPPQDTVRIVEDTANENSYQIVVAPVEFEITCTSGDKTIAVSKFNVYVKRTVAIPDGVDPFKITTGIVLNSDGTFSHVPTTIVVIDGKYYAEINSLTNSTYSVIYNSVEFSDVESHWAKDAVNDMGSRLVVSGVGNGNYNPNSDITRAEFATIIVKALGLKVGTGESEFSDVKITNQYCGYIQTACDYGIIMGYDNENFGPNDKITREQAMTMIARAMKLTELYTPLTDIEISELLSGFTDSSTASDYAEESIAECLKTVVILGGSNATISPKDYITRAEVAVIIQRLLQMSDLI